MSDRPTANQPRNLDHDDTEGHVLRAGKRTTDDHDVEGHGARASHIVPEGDDTEGLIPRGEV